MKAVNTGGLANEFHVWQRDNLTGCVIQDIDAWAIVASDADTYEPAALLELKRSYYHPADWMPYEADRPNYASLHALAVRAGIPFFTVYFQKGVEISDLTIFRISRYTTVYPDWRGRTTLITAQEFAATFPHLHIP